MFQRLLPNPAHALSLIGRHMSLGRWVGLLCLSGVFLLTAATNQSPCTENYRRRGLRSPSDDELGSELRCAAKAVGP